MAKLLSLLFLAVFTLLHAQTPESKRGTIALTFVDSVTKIPIKGAKVAIRNPGTPDPPVSLTTGDAGEVEFADLAFGIYYFSSVTAKGYVFELGRHDGMELRSAMHLKLDPVLLTPTSSITGTVLDADDKPIAGAIVDALNLTSESPLGSRSTATTDAQGHYRIEGISPGRAHVRVDWNPRSGLPNV